jgi:hypothetical protein
MQPSDWFMITRNRPSSSEFFLRSPFRHGYFLVVTFVLISMAVICALVLVQAQLSLEIDMNRSRFLSQP